MDTSNFQDLGESPNPSNDLQAGEFAKPSLVSPVSSLGAASIGSLVRITKDYRKTLAGEFCIITGFHKGVSELYEYYDGAFFTGRHEFLAIDFEVILPFSKPFYDLQECLVTHLNAFLSAPVDSANIPALLFVTSKLHDVILLDAYGVKRLDIEPSLFNACQFLRFGFEDLTNGSKFGRRVAGVFVDAAFEKLKRAAAILSAGYLVESPHTITSGLLSHSGNLGD